MSRSPSRTLKLTYLGDASQLSQSTRTAGEDVQTLGERAKNVGKKMAVAFAAIGAAGIAMGRKLFQAFEEVSTANARIEAVVTSMGNFDGAIGDVTERLVKQAEATARLTGVDRNLIKESQALLLTFDSVNKTADQAGGIFDRATDAAVDLAAAGFGSATSNAQSLGRALEDPIRGLTSLTRQGVTFTSEQQELIRSLVESNRTLEAQDVILKAIERQVGGTAEATANGSARMSQAFGILVEQIAQALAPAFERLVEIGLKFISDVAQWWEKNGPDIIEQFRDLAESVKDAWTELKEFGSAIRDDILGRGNVDRLIDSTRNLRDAFNETRAAFGRLRDVFRSGDTNTAVGIIGAHFSFILGRVSRLQNSFATLVRGINVVIIAMSRVGAVIRAIPSVVSALNIPERLVGLWERVAQALRIIASTIPGVGGVASPPSVPRVPTPTAPTTASNGVTINVSGAIDPEGTARTVARVINDSAQRGTGSSLIEYAPGLFARA